MIHRLPGHVRPCTRVIVGKGPRCVKQVGRGARIGDASRLAGRNVMLHRRWVAWWVALVSTLFLCGFGPPRLVDREIGPSTRVSVGELRVMAENGTLPDVTAESYLVYDLTGDRPLFAQAEDVARPPASLTKLMTALLAFERADLRATVEILPEDLVGGATMGLAAGDVVTVTDLLWGVLLPSGNDAASALARHLGGSVDAFVDEMNRRAAALGMDQSHFENPHGLDTAGHVSSADDLLLVTRALWQYPLFRTMVGTARVQWNGRTLVNTNEWLTTQPGATGVKTGTTDNAGECLVAAIEQGGRTLLIVILGSTQRYADAGALNDAYQAAYRWQSVNGRELSVLNRVYDETGQIWFVQPTGAVPTVLQNQAGFPPLHAYRRLDARLEDELATGTEVGVMEWWSGDQLIGAQGLVVR